ncbi:MAG: hypothetical protein ACE5GU_10650 [Candidatus Scalinduaceae bacterium]
MGNRHTPEKMAGKTANLIIFLGILYSNLSIVAITGNVALLKIGYGIKSVIVGLTIVGLGFGIRYGSIVCLYTVTGLFALLASYFMYNFLVGKPINYIIRFVFCMWAIRSLAKSIPAMISLKASGSLPDRSSRYKDFFLKHIRRN